MRHVAEEHLENSKPLTEPVLLILLSLTGNPQHGYALMQDIAVLSQSRVRLTTGTLYGALKRLLEDGWIAMFDQDDTTRDKQAYRLTTLGTKRLKLELERMEQLTKVAAARLREKEA